MKRLVITLASTVAASLALAGAADATVTWEAGTQTWFIGRGDVIAALGKPALVPNPVVVWSFTAQASFTCVFADGTRIPATDEAFGFRLYFAQPRIAPGSGQITGYFAGPQQIVDGEFWRGPLGVCSFLGGSGHGDVTGTVDESLANYHETLTFQGVALPAPTIGP
jgi:hypothetical protein